MCTLNRKFGIQALTAQLPLAAATGMSRLRRPSRPLRAIRGRCRAVAEGGAGADARRRARGDGMNKMGKMSMIVR